MNLAVLRQAFSSTDLRRKIFYVLALLVLFRLLAHVPVPVPDNAALAKFLSTLFNSNQLLGFANIFSGGALENFSIVMMGVGPYINASIIMQLLTTVVPRLEALNKEGEAGRMKISQYTRLLTLPLAILQSFGMIFLIQQTSRQIASTDLIGRPDLFHWILMIVTLTAGSMLIMWIGELITEKKIGNGISLIIFASIISTMPSTLGQYVTLTGADTARLLSVILFLVATLAVTVFVIYLNEGQRNIPVSYARRVRGSQIYSGIDTHLPIRIIVAGVVPIIFAIAFLSVPTFLGQIFSNAKTPWVAEAARFLTAQFSSNSPTYAIVYFLLIVGFTYFYSTVVFNTKDISENLQKQGGFVPGVRPGKETAQYLRRVANRLNLGGSVGLGIVAILPFIAQWVTNTSALTLGGTGLLIVVSVALETMKQIEAQAVMTSYERY